MTRPVVALLALWTSACDSKPPVTLLSGQADGRETAALVRQADEAFAALLILDYRRPFLREPDVAQRASDLYFEVCRAGDHRSCWLSAAIRPSERAAAMLRQNCRAGDVMSCRSLRRAGDEAPDQSLRGWAGFAQCDAEDCRGTLQQECDAGFPMSCWVLVPRKAYFEEELKHPLYVRGRRLALEGCRAGLIAECQLMVGKGVRDPAEIQLCRLSMKKCSGLIDQRWNEYGCQYGTGEDQRHSCDHAVMGYLEGRHPEPVPGRTRALIEWICRRLPDESSCLRMFRGPSRAP